LTLQEKIDILNRLKYGKPKSDLERAFIKYHRANPRVYGKLVQLSLDVKAKGFDHYAIATVWEVARWHLTFQTTSKPIKLPNQHRTYYSRLIMAQEPVLSDFFRTRRVKGDRNGRATLGQVKQQSLRLQPKTTQGRRVHPAPTVP